MYASEEIVSGLINKCGSTDLILSSIMPDQQLKDPNTIKLFRDFASRLGFKYLIVWDLPTDIDDYNRSTLNTEKSIVYIDSFRQDFNVILLVKGAYPEHIQYSCDNLYDGGFESITFHISEYLYSKARP